MEHRKAAMQWIRQQGEIIQGGEDIQFRIALIHALLRIGEQLEEMHTVMELAPRSP